MKFYGEIGFSKTIETEPGIWKEQTEPYFYFGDVIKNNRYYQSSNKVNDDFNISDVFSILADAYAFENFSFIRYVKYMGAKWKVNNVEIQYPRLILTTGGLYNG